jgi:hypothetical protein
MNNTISSTVYVGKDLSLAADGADVTLGIGVVGDLRFDADATISNYRPARMVIVNNSILSHMVKESFTGSFVFPVGIADGDYTPVEISNVSSNTVHVGVQDYVASTSAEATADPGPGGIPADGMRRTWHIYADAAGTGAIVNLQHNSSTNQSGFADASHFVTRWGTAVPNSTGDNTVGFSSSAWQVNTLAAGATGTLLTPSGTLSGSTMRSRAYSTFATSPLDAESYFTKSTDPFHPLPVNLISFSASSNQCDVVVKWASGVEHDLASYQLQHSTDGSQYSTIAILSPTGSNSSYSYVDKSPAQGNNQYRLKMADNDGKYQSSAIQQVKIDCAGSNAFSINVYPNPTSNLLTVEGMGANASSTLRVMNIHGQLVQELNTTNNKATLDISQLPSANYVLQVVQGNEIKINVKVVKQ